MTFKTVFKRILLIAFSAGLYACSNGGDGNTTNTATDGSVLISGQVVSSSAKSASITLLQNDQTIDSAITDTSSRYAISISALPESFRLVASNNVSSTDLGVAITGSPSALYFASDNFAD